MKSFEIRLFDILRFSLYRLLSPEQGKRLNHKPQDTEQANSEGRAVMSLISVDRYSNTGTSLTLTFISLASSLLGVRDRVIKNSFAGRWE